VSSFDEDERSASASRPIDLYTIQTTSAIYRMTSHIIDVTYGGNVFTATTMSRDALKVEQDPTSNEITVHLPITHPLVQRYAAFGLPEQQVLVTLQRLQERSGVAIQQSSGFGQALTIEGHTALMRVPSTTNDALRVMLPVISAQKICNHRLFDRGCAPNPGGDWPIGYPFPGSGGPSKAALALTNTLISQTIAPGVVTLVVDSGSAVAGDYFQFGDVVRNGEVRQCLTHLDAVLTINAPFIGAAPGDILTFYPGCAHTVDVCDSKFNNRINFGGHPLMNPANPWVGNGLGVIQQV